MTAFTPFHTDTLTCWQHQDEVEDGRADPWAVQIGRITLLHPDGHGTELHLEIEDGRPQLWVQTWGNAADRLANDPVAVLRIGADEVVASPSHGPDIVVVTHTDAVLAPPRVRWDDIVEWNRPALAPMLDAA